MSKVGFGVDDVIDVWFYMDGESPVSAGLSIYVKLSFELRGVTLHQNQLLLFH